MSVFSGELVVGTLATALRLATPLLWAGLGELVDERAGTLNVGLEGTMLFGAFTAYFTVYRTGNLWAGLLAAALVGAILSLVMGIIMITLRADQITTGVGFSILGAGMTFYLYRAIFGWAIIPPTVTTFPIIKIPYLSEVPVLGAILFQNFLLTWIVLLLVPIFWFILSKTTLGLKIKAVGENPAAAEMAGIRVFRVRYLCLLLSGIMAGISGAFFTIADYNMFLYNITGGRGYVAIAVCILGQWNPWGALLGALLFGAAEGFGLRLQAIGFALPYQFSLMTPYVVTIIALLMVSRRAIFIGPATLGKPYRRGQR